MRRWLAWVVLAAAWLFVLSAPGAGAATPSSAGSFAVASENAAATRAAIDTLRAGGNAVDAAIAACLVSGVANPTSSGIGGGGFALVWDAATSRMTALDFREAAPRHIRSQDLDHRPVDDMRRGLLVGVPGEVAGLAEMHRRWGRRTFQQDAEAAIRSAERGFVIEGHMARAVRNHRAGLQLSLALTDRFLRRGMPIGAGERVTNPALAGTLRAIATSGPSAFYHGPIAVDIARVVRDYGGCLDESDLAAYRVIEREPLHVFRDGFDVYTMPPPSAGGLLLAQTMLLHDRGEMTRVGRASAAYVHLLAEGFRGAIADRMRYVGDPDYTLVPTDLLLSDAHLDARRAIISSGGSHLLPAFALPEHGTMHLVVVDRDRNVVSLTSTVNNAFGSRLVAPRSGVLLNDELDDFTPRDVARLFGMSDGGPNAPRGGARPTSSMTPTVVLKQGVPVVALGGSGGTLIPTSVTQALLGMLWFEMPAQAAVSAPRFGVRTVDGALMTEPSLLPEAAIAELRGQGEMVVPLAVPAAVQAVRLGDRGQVQAGADPRKLGSARVDR
jgi:gamma-glutamyltranspeptidase/glutathione hydrolase